MTVVFPREGLDAKTSSAGIFSPKVRVSFAIFFRRISASVRKTGVVGVGMFEIELRRKAEALAVVGEVGTTRGSVVGTTTGFKRRTRGRGTSAERRPFEKDLGLGSRSIVDGVSESASDVTDELVEADEV